MLLRNLRERFVTHLIGDYVPVLNLVRRPTAWPTLEELRSYPEGSLGRHVAAYLDARGLPFKVRYENHDAIHCILDYETNIQGEMEVQAFLWANDASSPAGRILFVVGGALLPEQWRTMRAAYKRGRAATPIREATLPFRLDETLEAVRDALRGPAPEETDRVRTAA
jgi:ubiquinone biosynthesis protein Coq4